MKLETNVSDDSGLGDPPEREDRLLAGGGCLFRIEVLDVPTHHESNHSPDRKIVLRAGGHEFPIPENRHVIHEGDHVVENVRDVDNALALVPELTNDVEELSRLLRRKGGRRLVEDDNLGIRRQGLGNFYKLPFPGREGLHLCPGRDVEVDRLEQRLRLTEHPLLVHQRKHLIPRKLTDKDILRHGEIGEEIELLVNKRHSPVDRLRRPLGLVALT